MTLSNQHGVLMLQFVVLLFVGFYNITCIPISTEQAPERGPRVIFNETGRYLYPAPNLPAGQLLCKKCSKRALTDSTYSNEQQFRCIQLNIKKLDSKDTDPYCNVGEDLGCGPVPFNHTNSHWECDTGYSDAVHTVYSTCKLICNFTRSIIGKIYCRETLDWYVDLEANHCEGPRKQEDDGHILVYVVIGIAAVALVVVFGVMISVCICIKRRKISRSNTPEHLTVPLTDKNIAGEETPTSIGSCSIDGEKEPFIPSAPTDVQPVPLKVTTSTSTSTLDTVGRTPSDPSSGNTATIPGAMAANPNHGNLKTSGKSNDSRRSAESQATNRENDDPSLRIFIPNMRTSQSRLSSGLNNLTIQEHVYSVPKGCTVYYVPSKIVDSLKIERKDDGPEFRGHCFNPNLQNMFLLENATPEDAGTFRWTMTLNGQEYHDVFDLYVREPDYDQDNAQVAEVPDERVHSLPLTNERMQQSAIQRDDTTIVPDDHSQRINSNRLPPEGAENDTQQVSGQGNPNFNGARPKIFPTQVTRANTVISGVSAGDVKDLPPFVKSLRDSSTTNDLDKTMKDTENNLNQFDSPRNISENIQNILSLENNADTFIEESNNIELTTPDINLDTLLSESRNTSLNNSSNVMDGCKDTGTNEQGVDNVGNVGESLSIKPAPPLDFHTLLSSNSGTSNNDDEQLTGDELIGDSRINNRTDSVELPFNVLDDLKFDISEILNSSSSNHEPNDIPAEGNIVEDPTSGQLRSLSHLDPGTMDQELFEVHRPEPSGRSEPQLVVEGRTGEEETELKAPYNRPQDVRGERSSESTFNQPLAQVQLRNEESRHSELVPRIDDARVEEPMGELSESVGGAIGGVVQTERDRLMTERHTGPCHCKTLLKDLTNSDCLQELVHWANPKEKYGDARSWYGLALFYGHKRHFLNAVECAVKSQIYQGPMYFLVTVLFVTDNFTVGHLVSYFTQPDSYYQEIVDLLIDRCSDHVNCEYCERLRRRNRRNS